MFLRSQEAITISSNSRTPHNMTREISLDLMISMTKIPTAGLPWHCFVKFLKNYLFLPNYQYLFSKLASWQHVFFSVQDVTNVLCFCKPFIKFFQIQGNCLKYCNTKLLIISLKFQVSCSSLSKSHNPLSRSLLGFFPLSEWTLTLQFQALKKPISALNRRLD